MRLLLLFFFVFESFVVFSQNAEQLNCRFQQLYFSGDMKTWGKVIDSLRQQTLDQEKRMVLLYAEYGYIGNLLGNDQDSEAKKEMVKYERRLEEAIKQSPDNGVLYALSAANVGFKIGLQVWKAPVLGKENGARVKKAIQLSPDQALPWIELANSLYFRPAFVGGNKPLAITYYEKALALYKKQGGCNWVYYNLGAWLGQAYAKQGRKDRAEAMYRQILSEAPNFDWVKNELLPDLLKGKSRSYGKFKIDESNSN